MIATRTVFIASLLAIAAPAFAAESLTSTVTTTTRDERMTQAMQDYQSGKSQMAAPKEAPPAKPAHSSSTKKHHSTK